MPYGTLALDTISTSGNLAVEGNVAATGALAAPNFNSSNALGMRNRIINGAMSVDQRNAGASQTVTAAAELAYTVDRWYAYSTGANVTGQQVAGTGNNQFAYRFTGAAGVTAIGFGQRIEAANCFDLAGSTATLSVELANTALTTVTWTAFYATTEDTFGTLASPTRTQIATGTFTVNSTLTRYSTQIAVPVAATTGIEIVFTVGAQTSGTWIIDNVQFEAGAVATPFERRPIGHEFVLCQRYYEKSYDYATVPATTNTWPGSKGFSTNGGGYGMCGIVFVVNKRTIPTVTAYSPVTGATGKLRNVSGGAADWTVSYNNTGSTGTCLQTGAQTANAFVLVHYVAIAEL